MTRFMVLIAGMLAALPGQGQGIADPTRPPGGGDGMQAEIGSSGPVLQSVMLSPSRKVAVISGEMVTLGGKYGTARLVKLTESEAVLKNGQEITVLRLHPRVDKRAAGGDSRSRGEAKSKP